MGDSFEAFEICVNVRIGERMGERMGVRKQSAVEMSERNTQAIGLDIGTTTISGVVYDLDNQCVVASKTISNESFMSTENSWERIQNPDWIIEKAKGLLDELLERCPQVTSIGLTGQMHGILYLDRMGNCISPLYIWQDGRGDLNAGEETYAQRAARITGRHAATGYGLITHFYNLEHGLVPEDAKHICTIGDYLGMVLTGREEPRMHSSNAASLGFFEADKGKFAVQSLQRLGIDADILPPVTENFEKIGSYRGIPVTVAIGDNQASFIGTAGLHVETGTVLVNMGTGGQISVLSDVCFEGEGIEARPLMKGNYLLVGASLCGGRAYAILEKFFRTFAGYLNENAGLQYEVMEKMAQKAMKENLEMQVNTTFQGTRQNPQQRGSILEISENNFTPEGLTVGVLKGMAQELFHLFLNIQAGTGIQVRKLIASGNGLRQNPVLQEIFSELFKAELCMAKCEEEAACGAAISSAAIGSVD